ncbi:hypothetical protein RCL1_006218 [Eukaryota sp. TZLM3-RCL]
MLNTRTRRVLGNTNRRIISNPTPHPNTSLRRSIPRTLSTNTNPQDPSIIPFLPFDPTRSSKSTTVVTNTRDLKTNSSAPRHVITKTHYRKSTHKASPSPPTLKSETPTFGNRQVLNVPVRTWKGRYNSTKSIIQPDTNSSMFLPESERFAKCETVDAPRPVNGGLDGKLERIRHHEQQLLNRKAVDLQKADELQQLRIRAKAQQKLAYLNAVAEADPISEKIRSTCLPGSSSL